MPQGTTYFPYFSYSLYAMRSYFIRESEGEVFFFLHSLPPPQLSDIPETFWESTVSSKRKKKINLIRLRKNIYSEFSLPYYIPQDMDL